MPSYPELPRPPLKRPARPYPLDTYEPTGEVEPAFVLIEGGEKTGKTTSAVQATADPRIAHTWWIEIGEKPSVSEYGKKHGANLSICRNDGTIWSVLSLVEQVNILARDLIDHDKTPMIVIDSAAGVWEAVKALAHARTMESPSVKRRIAADPTAIGENFSPHQNTWNDVIDEWYRIIRILQRFPGIAVMISSGKEVAAVDDDGKPIPGERVYRVDGHKRLPFDVSAWVRMSRDNKPMVLAARSGEHGIRFGLDKPRRYTGIPDLVFGMLEFTPKPWQPDLAEQAHRQRAAGEPDPIPVNWDREFEQANAADIHVDRRDDLRALYVRAKKAHDTSRSVPVGLVARIEQAGYEAAEQVRIEAAQVWDDAYAEYEERAAATDGMDDEDEWQQAAEEMR